MAATTFNPLAAARELKAAGIEAEHAEAIAEGMREAADAAAGADRAELATKADLDELRRETKADLAELRAASRADIEALRSEMRWMLAFQAALILAIAAKLFGIVWPRPCGDRPTSPSRCAPRATGKPRRFFAAPSPRGWFAEPP